ncbi:hypothetical protein GE09DRAFT_1215520 [Coniochaeta sp. 2T2.1]|nr:hypothetical protein GE09DRAFT_1215520 [Coniochaeta sp. 2T2.1]
MDFDIEMDDVPVDAAFEAPEVYTEDIVGEEQEPGEIDEDPADTNGGAQSEENALVPYKVHIRGLDTFTPEDVKAYLAEHFGTTYEKIEWIDDTSLNLVFDSESVAQGALTALAGVEIADVTQLPPLQSITAKSFSKKPDSNLQIRFATVGDRKIAGAAARSRFYLLHPEYDPEERKRRGEIRGRYRDRDEYGRRGDRGRGRGNGRRTEERIDDYDVNEFDVSLYDDDAPALAKRAATETRARRGSSARLQRASPGSDEDYKQQNRQKELFPQLKSRDRNGGARRDRSASPMRDALDDLARDRAAIRNREQARTVKDRLTRDNTKDNVSKELFPTKVLTGSGGKAQMDQVDTRTVLTSAKLADRITPRPTEVDSGFSIKGLATKRAPDQGFAIKGQGTSVKELFPEKFGTAAKDLFPEKLQGRGRQRQKAEDTWH